MGSGSLVGLNPINFNQMPIQHPISYKKCQKFWSYTGKIVILTRHLLNASARNSRIISFAGENFPNKIKNITTHLKLLSIISVYFSLEDIKSSFQKIFKSVLENDKEGVALDTLSFTIIATDAFDSFTTFVNSALSVASFEPVKAFLSMDWAVSFSIVFLGMISRSIKITKTFKLYMNIKEKMILQDKFDGKIGLKKFLEEKLGIDNELKKLINSLSSNPNDQILKDKIEKLKGKGRAAILRAAPLETVNELEKLFEMLNLDDDESFMDKNLEKISKPLRKIQAQLQKKMKVEALGILANLFSIYALRLFKLGVTNSAPFALLATSFTIRISSLIYQDTCSPTY